MLKISNNEQGSPEWFADRMGKITASACHPLLTKGKGGAVFGKGAESYIYDVASEILTGMPKDDINGVYSLEWGKKREPTARASYEFQTGRKVQEVGFITAEDSDNGLGSLNDFVGFSADGIIFDEKIGTEIKCPMRTEHHLRFICEDKIKDEYFTQCQFAMMVSGFKQWDFISFDDRVSSAPLAWKTIYRDDDFIANLFERCFLASKAIQVIVDKINGRDNKTS